MKKGFILSMFVLASAFCFADFTTETPFSPSDIWEPSIAADHTPGSNWVYMIGTRLGTPKVNQRIYFRSSPDNGITWTQEKAVSDQSQSSSSGQADSTIQISNSGVVFICWLQGNNPGPVVTKSFDHGLSFSTPTIVWSNQSRGWVDKPWMTISPDGQEVYCAWYGQQGHFIARSVDGGNTFEPAVSLPANDLYWFPEGGCVSPVTGTVFFAVSAESISGSGPALLGIHRSTDHGLSWQTQILSTSQEAPPCLLSSCVADEFQASASIAVNESGTVMFLYSKTDITGTAKSLYVQTSDDDGLTWKGPYLVYAAPSGSSIGDGGFPAVAASPGQGKFGVIWQDNRNGSNAWNTFFRSTSNGGKTWTAEVKLSDLGEDPQFPYKSSQGYQFPYGDYTGLTCSAAGKFFAIWGEGTGRKTGGNTWFSSGD